MNRRETFTGFEGFSMLCISFLFHVFSGSLPQMTKITGNASWISMLLGMVLGVGFFFFIFAVLYLHPGRDLLDICEDVFGRVIGKALQFSLLLYFICYCINNLREGVELLAVNTYGHTKNIYLVAAFLAVVYIVALYPVKGLARTASVAVPLFFGAISFILIMSYSQYDVSYLFPIWGYGVKPIVELGFFHLSNYDGILVLAVFMGSYDSLKAFRKNGVCAVLVCGLSFFLSTLCYSMAGPYQANVFNVAGLLDLAQSIYINRFFQRFESVFVIFVSMGKLLVISVGMLAVKKTYGRLFAIHDDHQKHILLPASLLILTINQALFNLPRLAQAFSDFMRYTSLYFVLGLVLLLLGGTWLRSLGGGGRRPVRAVSLLLVLCSLCGLTAGCTATAEPDEEIFSIIMGYDRSDSETLRVTMKLMPEDKNSAGGSGGGDFVDEEGGEGSADIPGNVFIVDAPCNIPAADLINTVIPKHLSLLHVKMLVISEELAREDIDMLITPIVRYNEIKSTIALVICEGSAQDYITAKSSELIPFLPLETEMILKQKKGNASYVVKTMGDVYKAYISNYGDAVVMYGGLNKNNKKVDTDGKKESSQEDGQEQGQSDEPPPKMEGFAGGAPPDGQGEQSGGAGAGAPEPGGASQGDEEDTQDKDSSQKEGGGEEESGEPDQDLTSGGKDSQSLTQNDAINLVGEEFELHPDTFKQNSASLDGGEDVPSVFFDDPKVGYLTGYLPGEIPIQTTVQTQIAGMAVLKDTRMVGTLNTNETRLFMLADGSFSGAVLTVRDPYKPDYYVIFSARSRQGNKVSATVDDDGVAHIDITAYVQAELAIVQNTEPNYQDTEEGEMLREYTKQHLEEEIAKMMDKVQHEYKADILRLGRYVARNFKTIAEWEEYDWSSQYENAVINITVDMRL